MGASKSIKTNSWDGITAKLVSNRYLIPFRETGERELGTIATAGRSVR